MNAESSDWKRFIPVSEELNSIYKEMEELSKQTSFEQTDNILSPPTNRHYNIFGSISDQDSSGHIEQELNKLISKYDNATSSSEVILDSINTSLQTLNTIYKQYDEVSTITTTLYKECEDYVSEEKSLSRVLEELQEPLSYFRDLTTITNKIGIESLYANESNSEKNLEMEYDLYCNELTSIISRIFECIQFFRSHPSYKDSENYITKYNLLLNRVYSIIKNKFTSLLNTCSNQITEKNEKNTLLVSSTPLYYYMLALSKSNGSLISHILQIHSGTLELETESCFDAYCESRSELVINLFTQELESILSNEESLEARIRQCLLLLINVCDMENDQYLAFFNPPQLEIPTHIKQVIRASPVFNNSISSLLEEISMTLYEQIRPLILDTTHIEKLCDIVHMMKMEIIAGDLIKRNSFTAVIIPVIIKLEEDIRERIVYMAHMYIESTINNYRITSEDIDYPNKLFNYYENRSTQEHDLYSVWFTPVQKVLRILSLLYTCIDYTIMADLTVEAVQAVLHSILTASQMISSQQTVIDGELFRIKTLLILREQISPFDIQSTSTHLPFSDTSLQDNILYRLFKRAVSTIAFINQDGLRLLEDALKESTNHLIEAICRDVCDSTIVLIQQYEQFMSQAFSEDKFPLEEEQVVNLVSTFQEGAERLSATVGKIALYIDSPATQGILFAPIRRLLMNNVSHFKEILVHLKPNNFLRYIEQLNAIESLINAIDATKFSHENVKRPEIIQEQSSESSESNEEVESIEDPVESAEPAETIEGQVEKE